MKKQEAVDKLAQEILDGKYTIGYDPYDMTDLMSTGMEIFHVNSEGIITRIPVMSKKGQELLNRFNEEDI